MAESAKGTETLHIPKEHVTPLIARFGMVQNELAELIDLPPASAQSADAAISWWQSQKPEQQYTLRGALAALTSPMIIADVVVNSRDRMLVRTHAIIPSLRWNDPIFLFAKEKDGIHLRLEYLKGGSLFTNTLLLYLQGGTPLSMVEMKFEVPLQDFIVLLGMIDLRQRMNYRSVLSHQPYPTGMTLDGIGSGITEGFSIADPRWLITFCLPVLHVTQRQIAIREVSFSLDRLAKTELVQKGGDGRVSFTDPGKIFAESLTNRLNCIRIDAYGADSAGNRGRQSVIFIRGESLLWYAGISGMKADKIVVAAIGLNQAEDLLKELFTPVAMPKPVAPALQAPTGTSAASPPTVPTEQPASGSKKNFCPACGKPIRPNAKFCGSCGHKI